MLIHIKIFNKFFFAALISTSLFFSCNSSKNIEQQKKGPDSKSGTIKGSSYFPVSGTGKWQYINEAPRDESVLFNVDVESVKPSDDDIIAGLSSFPFFSGLSEKTTLIFKKDGQVYSISKDGKEELFLESDSKLKQGNTWEYGQWKAIVGNTNEKIVTENGTYENCIFINYSIYFTFSAELWLAKDVGIVKWGYNRTNPPTLKPNYYVLKNLEK
jgi:hypothetical protein